MPPTPDRFPSGSDYVDALQNPQHCFRSPELGRMNVTKDRLSRPKPISGNFASVFALTSPADGRRHAIKCFTRSIPDQEYRYQQISTHLQRLDASRLSQPWNVGFTYLPEEILVGNRRYPILKMDWVDATSLTWWIEQHLHQPASIAALAQRFACLVEDLASAGIAHGDLQHGNLLVADDGTFRLVDYDGMYVPALAGREAQEFGHANYQSPRRGQTDFGPNVDRFSAWVIYLSLTALAVEPLLWERLHEHGAEYLLLAREDYQTPAQSLRFPALLDHPVTQVRDAALQVRKALDLPLASVPRLAPSEPDSIDLQAVPPQSASPSPAPGLPDWMQVHVVPALPPTLPPLTFSGRRLRELRCPVLSGQSVQ